MLEIRGFEDEFQRLFTKNLVRGSTHLCHGQEAVAVGAARALRAGDTMTCTYRGHGAVLAMGAPLDATFAEILGRETGLCRGKGGSMHLTDVSVGAYGSFAIVGAHLPIANGTALRRAASAATTRSACASSATARRTSAPSTRRSTSQRSGSCRSIFVCENNLYGEYSPLAGDDAGRAARRPRRRLRDARRCGSTATTCSACDGGRRRGRTRARAGEGPTLIEALTYRHAATRAPTRPRTAPEGELERWLERDPILLSGAAARAAGVRASDSTRSRAAADAVRAATRGRALACADPVPRRAFEDVFA